MGVNSAQGAPSLIQDAGELDKWIKRLSTHRIIGVDTESNSLYAYQERVCLIQFSTAEEEVLIDPITIKDLSGLGEIFSNPRILKVFHAAEYDLFGLRRDFGFEFHNLFDTMIAARILGRPQVGLGALLKAEFGIDLDKRFQRANWGKRPLSPELLHYAQQDIHYLIPLYRRQERELREKGLEPLAQEDFQRLVTSPKRPKEQKNAKDWWCIDGAHDLPLQKLPVLQELHRMRDAVAQRLDCPPFMVLSDRKLIELARTSPTQPCQLGQLGILSQKELKKYGTILLAAIRRGLQRPPLHLPHNCRPNEEFLARLEALRQWRKTIAQKMGVPSDVILPREVMSRLADVAPKTKAELRQAMWDVPYRFEQFGEQILSLLNS
ncbi:MAG: HRDC domain-containing protein [Anaerolineales bacterium]|nr:HRDC domain-containing protein [Anaerolineales bacterium]MCS7248749.1 HRDC domain-containing protein [Anaerolineales bacterium]MDW8162562.1 HRDC domain-containing protein [Anaerolineales bacterium]MDW8446476.1 HRDC domain-containing protein [Anaerolineales bacterium]